MSSSTDDLHPGFGAAPHAPASPYKSFMRKRSYPTGTLHQPADGMPRGSRGAVPIHDPEGMNMHSSTQEGDAANLHSHQSSSTMPSTYAAVPLGALPRSLSQFTISSIRRQQTEPGNKAEFQHVQTMEDRLTFFQRHFTKAIDRDPDKSKQANNRRFSFLSSGCILAIIIMLLILLGVVAAAVAVTLDHRADHSVPSNTTSPINAAIDANFPDPTIWYNDGVWYALATNNAAGILQQPKNATTYEYGTSNVQIATSTDFVTWDLLNSSHDPLPVTGQWAPQGLTISKPRIPKANVWAPGIIQRPTDNKFVLYYSADRKNETNGPHHPPPHCIGAAVSETDSPAGPYDPVESSLACPIQQGGAIDPAGFQDKDGTLYVVYKVDGNNIGNGGLCGNTKKPIVPTPIMLQKMMSDGTTTDGEPITIMDRTAADGPLVEAPALARSHDGTYYLFFSSGCTRSPTYDVKYATSKNVNGPYRRAQYPLLQTGDWGLLAPGSVGVHSDGKDLYMAFHARVQMPQGRIRALFTTKLELKDDIARMVPVNSTGT